MITKLNIQSPNPNEIEDVHNQEWLFSNSVTVHMLSTYDYTPRHSKLLVVSTYIRNQYIYFENHIRTEMKFFKGEEFLLQMVYKFLKQ